MGIKHKSKLPSIFLLESLNSNDKIVPHHIYIVHNKINLDIKKQIDKLHLSWFSYEGHQCSAFLNDVNEVLREYFTHYGILFEHP